MTAPELSAEEAATVARFGIFDEEETVNLTPGVVWTDAQLAVVRDLTARAFRAEELLRRLVMDYGDNCDPWVDPCSCSIDTARRYLAALSPATTGPQS